MDTDRILKLIRLAKNNPEPEEAARAFELAQKLAIRMGLQIEELEAVALEEQAPEPPREVGPMAREWMDRWDRAVPWKLTIASAILRSNMCRCALQTGNGGGIVGYGAPEHLATARYIYLAVVREVDRLAQAAITEAGRFESWERSRAAAYGRAWRHGCADAIDRRMPDPCEEIAAARGEIDQARTRAIVGETQDTTALARATHALVRVERAEDYRVRLAAAVDQYYGEQVKGRRVSYQGGQGRSGYAAGRRAGERMDLGTGKRRGLPAARGR